MDFRFHEPLRRFASASRRWLSTVVWRLLASALLWRRGNHGARELYTDLVSLQRTDAGQLRFFFQGRVKSSDQLWRV